MPAEQRVVMLTGAAGNLGRAVAARFAEVGARLVLCDLGRENLERIYGAEPPGMLFAVVDLLDSAQVDASVKAAIARFGGIDVLVNIAGGFRMGEAVHETSDANWDFLFDINVRTLRNAVRVVVPQMIARGGGKIVNIGAHSALKGVAGMGAYCAAKSAVIRLTESMAAELRTKNINVNCVLPTIIDTPENRKAMPKADPALWVVPADLANVIVYLASDEARAIHGAALPVNALS